MNIISDPLPVLIHGEYTLLWVFFFGMFTMMWLQAFGIKLSMLHDWEDIRQGKIRLEEIGGKFVGVKDGAAVFKMVSTPPQQPQSAVDSEGGTDTKEG